MSLLGNESVLSQVSDYADSVGKPTNLWDARRIQIAKVLADALNRHFEADTEKELSGELKKKTSGY